MHKGGRHPGERCSETLLTMEKGVHRNSVSHFLAEHKSLSVKRQNKLGSGENLEMISDISPLTQANNK